MKKLNKITYQFFNNRKPANGAYNLDIKITGFDKDIEIKENNVDNMFFDISKQLENYLCIDIDNLKTFNLYLSHKNDNVSSEILFDASQVKNWGITPVFYFDANSLLYIEPFVTAKFDEYLEYYKGEPVYNEMYKRLRTGFNVFDIHKIKQVIPESAEDSKYVQTYDFTRPYIDDEVVVKKFANLSAVNMHSQDYSNCTIYLANNQHTSLIINNQTTGPIINNVGKSGYKPPYYENVDSTGDISLSIKNSNPNVIDFNMHVDYIDNETQLSIQQMPSNKQNEILNKITSLYLASESLSIVRGSMPLKSLTLVIKNELPERFQLGSFIDSNVNLKVLDLSNSQFKNIPKSFSYLNKLETLILSDTIEFIGDSAFPNLDYINNIVIPKKLKKIGAFGLKGIGTSGNITSLDFRDTQLETLEYNSLYSNASLKIYLPTTVTTIGDGAFGHNTTVYYKGTATGAPWGAKEVITEF